MPAEGDFHSIFIASARWYKVLMGQFTTIDPYRDPRVVSPRVEEERDVK